jgi:hypothetical protein
VSKPLVSNPIRAFAAVCVALTSLYVMYIGWRLIEILASPTWCAQALGAERYSKDETIKGLEACMDLMRVQLNALALDSHISQGVIALCLLTLIVIVIAGAKLDLHVNKSGLGANLSRSDELKAKTEGALQAAGAALDEADDIASGTKPVEAPAAPAAAAAPKFTAPPDGEL